MSSHMCYGHNAHAAFGRTNLLSRWLLLFLPLWLHDRTGWFPSEMHASLTVRGYRISCQKLKLISRQRPGLIGKVHA